MSGCNRVTGRDGTRVGCWGCGNSGDLGGRRVVRRGSGSLVSGCNRDTGSDKTLDACCGCANSGILGDFVGNITKYEVNTCFLLIDFVTYVTFLSRT